MWILFVNFFPFIKSFYSIHVEFMISAVPVFNFINVGGICPSLCLISLIFIITFWNHANTNIFGMRISIGVFIPNLVLNIFQKWNQWLCRSNFNLCLWRKFFLSFLLSLPLFHPLPISSHIFLGSCLILHDTLSSNLLTHSHFFPFPSNRGVCLRRTFCSWILIRPCRAGPNPTGPPFKLFFYEQPHAWHVLRLRVSNIEFRVTWNLRTKLCLKWRYLIVIKML